MMSTLLSIQGLEVSFSTEDGVIKAVGGVSYDVDEGRTVAVVGESGCGKSVTSLAILRLLPIPPGRISGGRIYFRGEDLTTAGEKRVRQIRGNEIAMIFQEPMTSLNPVYTIGDQIAETITQHQKLSEQQVYERVINILDMVGIGDPKRRVEEYPHQLSGGMRQRIMIAIALSCDPSLLIADEPTTALDVTIQAQILELLREIQRRNNMSILLITHDLGVVAENADDVVVMYASMIAEKGGVEDIFADPLHPYTKGLLDSLPRLGEKQGRLKTIEGSVPDPLHFPAGCKFHPRCPICKG
jgi:oligopeptide/dipeptide ABC transporter ATP-binding protein